MDSASQEQRLKWSLKEQYRLKQSSHFPSKDGDTLIILILLDQLGGAAHLQLGLLGTNSINAPRQ